MASDTCPYPAWPSGPLCSLAPGHPGQHHGGWTTDPLASVEPGVRTTISPDDVRGAHVPWPGHADDGTCSCCGMPYPCVARRLADEVEQLRAATAEIRAVHAEVVTVAHHLGLRALAMDTLAILDRPASAGRLPAGGVNANVGEAMDGHDDPTAAVPPAAPGPSRTSAAGGTT